MVQGGISGSDASVTKYLLRGVLAGIMSTHTHTLIEALSNYVWTNASLPNTYQVGIQPLCCCY
jgi:hypothetical protein